MKGLIIKDFFCLKKQLINYGFILVGVVAIAVMFVLSYKFGNIHAGMTSMVAEGEVNDSQIVTIASMALLLFMLIPIACTGDITILFTDDANASFYKVASSLPVTTNQRVASRFITGFLFIGIGVVVDLLMTVVISGITDIISFSNFCGLILSFASLMTIYISLVIALMYLFGNAAATYANIVPIIMFVMVGIAANWGKLRAVLVSDGDEAIFDFYNDFMDFVYHKYYVLIIAAVIIAAGSYLASVFIADKKKEVA